MIGKRIIHTNGHIYHNTGLFTTRKAAQNYAKKHWRNALFLIQPIKQRYLPSTSFLMFNSNYMDITQIKSRRVPAGETIYYRIMANTAPTEYMSVGLRYIYE